MGFGGVGLGVNIDRKVCRGSSQDKQKSMTDDTFHRKRE